jgi:hypothetical protein
MGSIQLAAIFIDLFLNIKYDLAVELKVADADIAVAPTYRLGVSY